MTQKTKKVSTAKRAVLDKFLRENYLPGNGPEYLARLQKKRPDLYRRLQNPSLSARLAVKLGMLRNQKGWTQKQAAARVEIGVATYQNLEEAKPTANPTLKVLVGLAGAYNVKFEELFTPENLLLRNVFSLNKSTPPKP
jgi:DNA-binding XRE family transcriptional regulator